MKNIQSGPSVWTPYTQMKTAPMPLMAEATNGTRITLSDGRELIDGVASWWTACHGYNHPHIIASMKKQLDTMPHVMFGGLVHEPALRLASRLAALAPGDLNHVFYVDSGSVSVEVGMKMALQYWINRKVEGRIKFVGFRHSYHGDTIATGAVRDQDEDGYGHFKAGMPEHFIAALPEDKTTTEAFDNLLSRERNSIAAVLIEPMVQGVGDMRFHDAATLKRVAELCAKHNVLLIADEIFTGFGRTGTMFACEQAEVVPDIMCVGKALTGGAISLAATIARKHIFDAFWLDDPHAALMHGPTYMANPLACSAANASLDLFEQEPRLQQIAEIEKIMLRGLEPCRGLPGVVDVRVKGAIGVVQMEAIPNMHSLRMEFVKRGVWIRPFGNIIYLAPSFTIDQRDLTKLMDAIVDVVQVFGATLKAASA